jgi:hypothetical protein
VEKSGVLERCLKKYLRKLWFLELECYMSMLS